MPLIDLKKFGKMGKFYRVRVKCDNCGELQELSIPKGETIKTYIEDDRAVCLNCGCNTLSVKKGERVNENN